MNVIVIGAGPAGLTAAYQLSKSGVSVQVYEASDRVGGMAATISLWGQKADLGPHRFFSQDDRINGLFKEVLAGEYSTVERLTRIYYRNKFFLYPLSGFDVAVKLGPIEALLGLGSYFYEKVFSPKRDESTFEGWVTRRFGQRLFRTFFKSYSEKLWGLPCDQLDSDFAAQRIKKFSLLEALRHTLIPSRHARHATLVESFSYPHEGTGSIYQRMAALIEERGSRVVCNKKIKGVRFEKNRAIGVEFEDGSFEAADHVISTMPLPLLMKSLPNVPAEVKEAADRLQFRNTILVYLHVDAANLFRDNWIYVHSPELKCGRITNFKNWGGHFNRGATTTILAMEYWCSDGDLVWAQKDEELIDVAKSELGKTGLAKSARILDGAVVRIPRCYPVYRHGYRHEVQAVAAFLKSISGLIPIGRYGSFKYNNQDHSILMGILAAENISGKGQHDLWAVNSDEMPRYIEESVE